MISQFLMKTCFLVLFFSSCILSKTKYYPSSCTDLSDGEHLVKFLDGDEYPVVKVQCSNGYAILDYNLDSNIESYFNSWQDWILSFAGPDNSHIINWEEWFEPANQAATSSSSSDDDDDDDDDSEYIGENLVSQTGPHFLISPTCDACSRREKYQLYNAKTTYWMTGTIFGCFWPVKGAHNCDMSYDDLVCYNCGSANFIVDGGAGRIAITDDYVSTFAQQHSKNQATGLFTSTGICPKLIHHSNSAVAATHAECSGGHEVTGGSGTDFTRSIGKKKPSIGTNGQNCVCYDANDGVTNFYSGTYEEEEEEEIEETIPDTIEYEGVTYDYYELTSSDFEAGTYRIRKSGYYKIMENIEFNFNSGDLNDPQSNYGWMPYPEQNDEDLYPGAADYHDTYFLGFFAGIAVEIDNVIIDLNENQLAMHPHFYYQQRWFTTIELSKQYFFPGQGIGNFGAHPYESQNVLIMNGILGLTSHHGIHGNYNQNVKMLNLQVRDFETHGIQFNGFTNIEFENVEIGPTTDMAILNGEYGHFRFILPRLKEIAEQYPDEFTFYGRDESTTMQEIYEEIEMKMNMAWNYVVNGASYDDDDNDWISAKELFINENGIPYASAMYGIFLNTFGASVFTYNLYNSFFSDTVNMKNVIIHDMKHQMIEYERFYEMGGGDIYITPFNAPLNARSMVDDIENLDVDDIRNGNINYKGDILTDAYIAMDYLSDNWNYLALGITEAITDWAISGDVSGLTSVGLGCNSDVMLHSGKGVQGLRLDGVSNLYAENLEIYNIYEYTDVGLLTCGEYESLSQASDSYGGHFRQTLPMQVGFSGNMNQAINLNAATSIEFNNLYIHDLSSSNGPVYGIAVWPNCDVKLSGDVTFSNFNAGKDLDIGTYTFDSRPNIAPEACTFRVYSDYTLDLGGSMSYEFESSVVAEDNINVKSCAVSGHVYCMGVEQDRTTNSASTSDDEDSDSDSDDVTSDDSDSDSDSDDDSIDFSQYNHVLSSTLHTGLFNTLAKETMAGDYYTDSDECTQSQTVTSQVSSIKNKDIALNHKIRMNIKNRLELLKKSSNKNKNKNKQSSIKNINKSKSSHSHSKSHSSTINTLFFVITLVFLLILGFVYYNRKLNVKRTSKYTNMKYASNQTNNNIRSKTVKINCNENTPLIEA